MNIVVPYTPDKLRPETRAAAGAAAFVDVSGDGEAYWRLLRRLWARGTTFVLVEHDLVPPPGMLDELWACRSEWCGCVYNVGRVFGVFHGIVKYGGALTRRHPTVVDDVAARHWGSLDSMVITQLSALEPTGAHWHWPAAEHLNPAAAPPDDVFANCPCGGPLRWGDLRGGPDAASCPRCSRAVSYFPPRYNQPAPRRRDPLATRLRYVGGGVQFLNGFPARDHDTDDPERIATALASGLYVRDTRKPKAPARPEPTPVVAAPVAAADNQSGRAAATPQEDVTG